MRGPACESGNTNHLRDARTTSRRGADAGQREEDRRTKLGGSAPVSTLQRTLLLISCVYLRKSKQPRWSIGCSRRGVDVLEFWTGRRSKVENCSAAASGTGKEKHCLLDINRIEGVGCGYWYISLAMPARAPKLVTELTAAAGELRGAGSYIRCGASTGARIGRQTRLDRSSDAHPGTPLWQGFATRAYRGLSRIWRRATFNWNRRVAQCAPAQSPCVSPVQVAACTCTG